MFTGKVAVGISPVERNPFAPVTRGECKGECKSECKGECEGERAALGVRLNFDRENREVGRKRSWPPVLSRFSR